MHWQYTPYIFPLLIAAVISIIIATQAWQRRTASGAKIFTALTIMVAVWALGYALELGGGDIQTKVFFAKVQYLAIVAIPLAWMVFSLQFANLDGWLTRRKILLLVVVPVITLILVWTNESHNLIWRETNMDTNGPFSALDVTYGPWFWTHSAFSYILLLVGTIVLFLTLRRSTHLYRQQAGMVLVGVIAPWVGNGIYLAGLTPISNLDLTPFAFTISGAAIGYGLFRYRFLDVIPIARRAVVEGMSDGVIVFDTKNRVVDINPVAQRAMERNTSVAIGQTIDQIFAPWPDLLNRYRHVSETRAEFAIGEERTQRHLEMSISPLYSEHDRLMGRLFVFRDITKRKHAEEELVQARDQALAANRLKSELLARVSHEFRTPLNSIQGHTELLEMGVYGGLNDKQKQATAKVVDNCASLSHLVSELLDQASLEAGRLILNNQAFTPIELLDPIQRKLNALAEAKGLTLSGHVDPGVPNMLFGDLHRLQQVLTNLGSNAVKFTPTGDVQISIYCPDDEHWAMKVSDTGPGIPLDAQEYIFDPFRQMDGSLTRRYGGTGLGLSVVKDLTTLMGGQILLDSQVEHGSTFTVTFPLIPIQDKKL